MTRRDWAVVLARGESRRMGRPKGLCRLTPDAATFIAAIATLYRGSGWPLAVVTTEALAEAYARELPDRTVTWIKRPGGRGTAESVVAACEELRDVATHLWLHPVDLPAVCRDTVVALARVSRDSPAAVVVPMHGGTPGHPVVLPVTVGERLRGRALDGKLRPHLLALARESTSQPKLDLREVDVPDRGVIEDHDFPPDASRGDAGEEV